MFKKKISLENRVDVQKENGLRKKVVIQKEYDFRKQSRCSI